MAMEVRKKSYGSFLLIGNPGNVSGHQVCKVGASVCLAILLANSDVDLSTLESNLPTVDP